MATQAALEGLELDLDAARFDAALARLFGGAAGSEASSSEGALALPLEGASLWIGDPSVESGLRMVLRWAANGFAVRGAVSWGRGVSFVFL
ncbi:hypothetical protein [Variovorax sp. UC122_21]|uniref:hypothetical protein n=1 Tax=Variovorax sp. UC122_21 TaxID=3374554 RepID=UPI0037568507